MHHELFSLLPDATGDSQFVVAVFLDVRGFSAFAGTAESVEAAVFLKKMYHRVLTGYLVDPAFFKPTGDGLMVIFSYDESSLQSVATSVVSSARRLVADFATMLSDEPMLNFDLPTNLGIGVARGPATRLSSKDKTLDYSGRPLNLAARLMDFARPQGVVLDNSFGPPVLPADVLETLQSDAVYIKGIAEHGTPRPILLDPEWTTIREDARRPIGRYEWVRIEQSSTLHELAQRGNFHQPLKKEPAFPDEITIRVRWDLVSPSGRRNPKLNSIKDFKTRFQDDGGDLIANIDYNAIVKHLREDGVKDASKVRTSLRYRVVSDA